MTGVKITCLTCNAKGKGFAKKEKEAEKKAYNQLEHKERCN